MSKTNKLLVWTFAICMMIASVVGGVALLGADFSLPKSQNNQVVQNDSNDYVDSKNVVKYDYLPLEVENGVLMAYTGEDNAVLKIPASYSVREDGKLVEGNDYRITKIGENAFKGVKFAYCEVDMTNINEVGKSAFENAKNVHIINGQNGYHIGDYAFKNAKVVLEQIVLLADSGAKKAVGTQAFTGTQKFDISLAKTLANAGIVWAAETTGTTTITTTATRGILTFGAGTAAAGGNMTAEVIDLENFRGIVIFENYAFAGKSSPTNTSLTTVKLGSGMYEIGDYSFWYCSNLGSELANDGETPDLTRVFSMQGSITKMGESSFEYCNSLKHFDLSNALISTIGISTFARTGLTSITIPNRITSIGNYAFDHCSGLTSITIGSGVTSIGYNAFSDCSGLTSITIGSGVTIIGLGAFRYCSGLTSITIPNSVTRIEDFAFQSCFGLTSITIESGVTSIGGYAFSYCPKLTSITIPNSVTSIGSSAFFGCTGLTSIVVEAGNSVFDSRNNCNAIIGTSINTLVAGCKNTSIPNSVTSIDYYAFYGCTGLTSITIPDSVTSIGSSAFSGCSGLTGSLTIPNSVTSIGDETFRNCSGLTSITIPDSVTSIGSSAFSGCSGLTSLTIGSGVTSISLYAFSGCSGLTSITIERATPPTLVNTNAFDSTNNCPIYVPAASVAAYKAATNWKSNSSRIFSKDAPMMFIKYSDDSVQYAECAAAATLSGLTLTSSSDSKTKTDISSVGFSPAVTSIGSSAFSYCSGLTSITIGSGVTSIGEYAFYYCDSLTSITIPDSVTSIGSSAFSRTGLTSITIPNSVTSIGNDAFYFCDSLTSIVVEAGNSVYDSRNNCNAIIETATNTLIAGCKNSTIPNSVTSIGDGAFYGCSSLTSLTIGSGVTSIGNSAFYGCSNLTNETYNPSYNNAYYLKNASGQRVVLIKATGTGITECTIDSNTKFIYGSAFSGCSGLTSITIPNSVTSIGSSAFSRTGLTSITIPNSVTSIGDNAFKECEGLTLVTIGSGVTKIGDWAFVSCYGLTSITIGSGVTSIGQGAFVGCSSLTSINIPNSVTSIGISAFSGCYSLTSITVAYDNTTYDSRDNCNAIIQKSNNQLIAGCKNTIIPNSVTSIGSSAFSNCSDLTSITIPDSVTSIGSWAFNGCSDLTSVTFANASNWQVSTSSSFSSVTDLSSADLSNTSTAATYLKSTHYTKYWRRTA